MIGSKLLCILYIWMLCVVLCLSKEKGPSILKTAYFGVGCFWAGEAFFDRLDGVHKSQVGFNPEHTELVEVQYDPMKIAFEELLDSFWNYYNPIIKHENLYRSTILYTDDEQKFIIQESINKIKQKYAPNEIDTVIKMADVFYRASNYNQKYWLRAYPKIVEKLNLSNEEIVDSTLAAKLNGFVSNSYNPVLLRRLKNEFNLSSDIEELLKN